MANENFNTLEVIDGIFIIKPDTDNNELFEKLSERLAQLAAATVPGGTIQPDTLSDRLHDNYMWMLNALTVQAFGIADELYTRQIKANHD